MCGINGFLKLGKSIGSKRQIELMNNLIIHRGPDSQGDFVKDYSDYTVALGMRRLSIIDLDNGNQPLYSEDKTKVIVFNGEIYNYLILKADLIKKGCFFNTNSDTEVILKLYEMEGPKSFSKLDGMFTFCIHDEAINRVYLARDFFGEKPLYYTQTESGFLWSSELKSVVSAIDKKLEIDNTSLSLYFQLTYIPAPYTIYCGIKKLEANHYIELDCINNLFSIIEIERTSHIYNIQSKNQAINLTQDLVRNSVISRSISDVSIGTFLSGGVDSSIVTLCLAQNSVMPIDTFSIGFEKNAFDESDKSRLVSKLVGSNHHEFKISEKKVVEYIDDIILNFDEPFADSSALATYMVSRETRNFVKVALTGDGGDEVFGGYNKYYMGKLNRNYTNIIPKGLHHSLVRLLDNILVSKEDSRGNIFRIKRFLKAVNYDGDFYYNIVSLGFTNTELNLILNRDCYDNNALMYYKDLMNFFPTSITDFRSVDKQLSLEGDMLVKVDRSSMLASLECRSPFLNKELWDYTNQLPEDYLIKGWDKKHILKEAFKDFFPKDFLNKSKKGFAVPVGDWLRSDLRMELLSYIDKSFIIKQNIFDFDAISNLVNNHINGRVDSTFRVWTFYCFQKWYNSIFSKLNII